MPGHLTKVINVEGLKLYGYHGVSEQETLVGNTFIYDLSVSVDWLDAAITDDVERTINYADLVALIRTVNERPARLLETLAYAVYRAIAETYPTILSGHVKVTKPKPPIAGAQMECASVELDW